MKKVFLGGTCNKSTWRDEFVKTLTVDSFNPVVEDWTEECAAEELKQRNECDFCLYTITPKMKGVYSIAEVVDDSNKRPQKTVLVVLNADDGLLFEGHETKALHKVAEMVESNGGKSFNNLESAAIWINSQK